MDRLRGSTLHGISPATDSTVHVAERLGWLFAILICTYGMAVVFLASYSSFENNPVSFVTETAYLNWSTVFPAVTVCQLANPEIFDSVSQLGSDSVVQNFVSEVVFFTGSCYSCSKPCDACRAMNMSELVVRYRKGCNQLLDVCLWNGVPFKCCDRFRGLDTEYGRCFSINSMHHTVRTDLLMSNRFTGPGELSIITLEDMRVFVHAPEDVPFINADPDKRDDVLLGDRYVKQVSVVEIENDEQVKRLAVEKRGCRFPWETPPGFRVHQLYSYSTCVVQCHADAHLRLCNCTHHLMPGGGRTCDADGLRCLTANYDLLNRLHASGSDKRGLECVCEPSCTEPEYSVVFKESSVSGARGRILIRVQSLPTRRYRRNVIRTTLDLVVSVGGTAGLFFGASLLSIIETVYLLCVSRRRQ